MKSTADKPTMLLVRIEGLFEQSSARWEDRLAVIALLQSKAVAEIFDLGLSHRLPLHVRRRIRAATFKWNDVIPAHQFRRRAASARARCNNAGVGLATQADERVGGTGPGWKRFRWERMASPSRHETPIPDPAAAPWRISISRPEPVSRDSEPDGFLDEGRGPRVFRAGPGESGQCAWFRCARGV